MLSVEKHQFGTVEKNMSRHIMPISCHIRYFILLVICHNIIHLHITLRTMKMLVLCKKNQRAVCYRKQLFSYRYITQQNCASICLRQRLNPPGFEPATFVVRLERSPNRAIIVVTILSDFSIPIIQVSIRHIQCPVLHHL